MTWRSLSVTISSISLLAVVAGCSGPAPERRDIVVSAAASLTDALAAIETGFEDAYPAMDVRLNLGASSALREQILEGAGVDVFASADVANMEALIEAGEAESSQVFAANLLQIAVPAGNPAGITGLADFARDEFVIGLCVEGVPCGDFARQVLTTAGVAPAVDTNETDVRALIAKIQVGELDAGIAYVTDVLASEGVEGIDIAPESNVVAEYPIAVLNGAPNSDGAKTFVGYVISADGQEILQRFGFGPP